jgi:hypothetical protein
MIKLLLRVINFSPPVTTWGEGTAAFTLTDGQHHVLAALTLVGTGREAGWATGPVWTDCRIKNSLPSQPNGQF